MSIRSLCLITFLIAANFSKLFSQTTYYTAATGNWNQSSTWSTIGFGNATNLGTYPQAGDVVNIGGGFTVTVTGNESCSTLTYESGSTNSNTVSVSSGNSLTMSGAITLPQATSPGVNILDAGSGTLNAASISFTNGSAGGTGHRVTIGAGTVVVSGNVTGTGTSSKIQFTGAGLLRLGGTLYTAAAGALTTFAGSTVEYNAAGAQTVSGFTYQNLTLSGSGNKSLGGTTTVAGNLSVGSGTNFVLGFTITVTGATTVDGTLSITIATGARTFVGQVTINATGTWNNTANGAVVFRGGITNNGTFNAGTGVQTFNTNSQALIGTFVMPSVSVNGAAVALTNNNSLTVGTALAGTGRLTQGASATLNLGGTSAITNMTATASGNMVNYTGAGQTVKAVNYYNLSLSGSGTATLGVATTTISGNLTLSGTVSTTGVVGMSIGGNVDIGSGTSFTAGAFTHNVAGNWTNNGTFTHSGGTINLNGAGQTIGGGSTGFNNLTLSGSGTKTFGVSTPVESTLSIANGALADLGSITTHAANVLSLGGSSASAGTWGSTSSGATYKVDTYFLNTSSGIVTVTSAGAFVYYTRATGNWNQSSTWSTIGFGNATNFGTYPQAGDVVNIGGGFTVTVTGNESCSTLTYESGSTNSNTVSVSTGNSLTMSGAITLPQATSPGVNILDAGSGTLNAASISFTNGSAGGTGHRVTIDAGTVVVSGNVTGTGTSSKIQFTGAGLLRLGGKLFTVSMGTLTTFAGSTVEYNVAGAQTVQLFTYQNLTLSGSGNKSLSGTTTVAGNLSVGSGTNFALGAFTVTVMGTTTLDGTLSITSASGTNTFKGQVTINATGTWNNTGNGAVVFRGGITNNGTFNAGTGVQTFNVNPQSLSGTFVIPSLTVTSVVLTNNNSLTVGTTLAGTGGLTQGASATLNLGGTSAITNMTATASGNTVNYTGAGQTVKAVNYYNLSLSGSGTVTLGVATKTISGNLTLSGTVSTTGVVGMSIGGNVDIGSGTSFTAGAFTHNVAGNWTNNGTFTHGGGTINLNGAGQTIGGGSTGFNNLTLSGSGTKTFGVSTPVESTLSIANGALADLGSITTHTANGLWLGGGPVPAGTWGSSTSGASNQNDTYFLSTSSGIVTLTTGGNTFYTAANGDWSSPSTWSTIGYGGASGSSTPGASDQVRIGGGFAITVNGTESCESMLFDQTILATNSVTINGSLTSNGAVTIPMNGSSNTLAIGSGALTAASLDFTAGTSSGTQKMTIGTGTVTVSGNVTGVGATSTIQFTGAGLLQLGGALYTPATGTLTTFAGSTVEYNAAGAQTVQGFTYKNLILSGSGNKTLGSTCTIGGNLNVGSATNLIFGASAASVIGATTVDGTLSITSVTGAKTFSGQVTINAIGTWNNTANTAVTFKGGITNNGTFNAGSGVQTFNMNSQSLTGTFVIPSVTVTAPTVLTNNGSLTVGTALGGTGGLTQGASATLNLGGTSTITSMTATASGNTVNYTGAGQTVQAVNYYHLGLSGSGTATLGGATTTISGNLSLSGTVSTTGVVGMTIGGNINIGSGTSFTAGAFTHNVAGNWTNNGTFTHSGGTINFNGATQTATGAVDFNNLQVNSSSSFTAPSALMQIAGNFTNTSPSFLHNNGTISFNGSTQAAPSGVNFNNLQISSSTSFTAPASTMLVSGNFTNTSPSFIHNGGTVNFNGATQTVTGAVNFNHLQINSSVSFTAPATTMGVGGDFTNNSPLFLSNNGTVSFFGSALQHVQGSAVTTFNNIIVSNSTPTVSVTLESSQNLLGTLTLSAGSIFDADGSSNNSVFTLLSSADKPAQDASIASIPATASVIGNVTVQRYFGVADDVDRFISSPVSNATVAQLQQAFPITGSFTGTSFPCTGCSSNNPSLKWYNERSLGAFSNGYTGFPSGTGATNSAMLVPSVGYDAWMWNGVAATTVNFKGTINQGTIAFKNQLGNALSYTNSGTPTADGWNLVGNPYPSAIQWNNTGWSKGSNIDPTVWVWDVVGNVWHSYNANTSVGDLTNGVISIGQAFWVYVTGASSGLTIMESAKSTSGNGSYYRKAESDIQTLIVSLNQGEISENSYLIPKSQVSGNYFNSVKPFLGDERFSIAIMGSDNVKYGHYSLTEEEESIPLFVYGKSPGEYSISFDLKEGLKIFDGFYLVDLELRTSTQVLPENKYTFTLEANERFKSENRFILTKKPDLVLSELALEKIIKFYPNPAADYLNIDVNSEDVKEFVLMNNSGDVVTPIAFIISSVATKAKVNLEILPPGLYFIKGLVNGKVVSEKIVKYK